MLGRLLALFGVCFISYVAITSVGSVLVRILGLAADSSEVPSFTEPFERPLALWLGDSQWVSALRDVFSSAALLFSSLIWLSGLLRLTEAEERN